MKTTRLSALILSAAFASAFTAVNSLGGSHTWSGAVDGKWSVAGNWSSGGAPVSGESPLHLSFPSGATRLMTTNDIAGLQIDSITITADGYVFAAQPGAGIALKGAGLSIIGNGNATFGASVGITLNGFNYFTIGSGKQVTLDSAVGGSGLLAKIGPGTLRLRSASGNSYSGGTVVNDGTLLLECGGVAVPGVLNVGSTNTSIPAVVKLAATEQIANDAPIIVYPSGRIDLNGFVETVGPLTFTGGGVYGNGGSLLRLNGDVTGLFWLGLADLRAPISLGGTNRTFTTGLGSLIYVVGSVADGGQSAGIIKAGPGALALAESNNYAGMTWVNEGRLSILDNDALGSTNAGTVVANGATLRMEGMTSVGIEPLVLNGVGVNNGNGALQAYGTNAWDGPITLMSDSDVLVFWDRSQLTLNGPISGHGVLRKTGEGPLTFAGNEANLYTNVTVVAEGSLRLAKPQNVNAIPGPLVIGDSNAAVSAVVKLLQHEQIADTSTVSLAANGTLDCSNRMDSVGALIGNGSVLTGSGYINAGGDHSDFTFHGTISGASPIVFNKIGTGTMTLAGAIASGSSRLLSGRLIVNGNHPGPITVYGPMSLAGAGSVGDLRFTGSGLLKPGTSFANTPGILTSGALSLTNGTSLFVELFGTDAGTGYDQVDVTGSVNLTGSKLRVRLGAAMPAGSEFVLIRNDGLDAVTGTFDGLPEGGTFTTNAIQFQISYQGGDGNDVVLEQITPAPELRFQSITPTAFGQMRVIGSGVPGFTYQVQANTDLNSTNWIVIGSSVASPNGNFALTDTNSLNHPIRFYRFVHD